MLLKADSMTLCALVVGLAEMEVSTTVAVVVAMEVRMLTGLVIVSSTTTVLVPAGRTTGMVLSTKGSRSVHVTSLLRTNCELRCLLGRMTGMVVL